MRIGSIILAIKFDHAQDMFRLYPTNFRYVSTVVKVCFEFDLDPNHLQFYDQFSVKKLYKRSRPATLVVLNSEVILN